MACVLVSECGAQERGGGGGHSQTEVVPMLVRAPQNWTLNDVIPGVKIYPQMA